MKCPFKQDLYLIYSIKNGVGTTMTTECVVGKLHELLVPVISIITVYIVYQQWKTNRLKLTLDRYDRRYRIYEEVRFILYKLLNDPNKNDIPQFARTVSGAIFLFGPEIQQSIDDIIEHGSRICELYSIWRDDKQVDYHANTEKQINNESNWILRQDELVKKQFMKYLRIYD